MGQRDGYRQSMQLFGKGFCACICCLFDGGHQHLAGGKRCHSDQRLKPTGDRIERPDEPRRCVSAEHHKQVEIWEYTADSEDKRRASLHLSNTSA